MLSLSKMTLLTASDPARDPVWEDAAADPAWVLPLLKMTMGFLTLVFWISVTNFSPLVIPSQYIPRTLVWGSSMMSWMMSASSRSALFP